MFCWFVMFWFAPVRRRTSGALSGRVQSNIMRKILQTKQCELFTGSAACLKFSCSTSVVNWWIAPVSVVCTARLNPHLCYHLSDSLMSSWYGKWHLTHVFIFPRFKTASLKATSAILYFQCNLSHSLIHLSDWLTDFHSFLSLSFLLSVWLTSTLSFSVEAICLTPSSRPSPFAHSVPHSQSVQHTPFPISHLCGNSHFPDVCISESSCSGSAQSV